MAKVINLIFAKRIYPLSEQDFISNQLNTSNITDGSVTWKTPSNIALVKYWGKKENQIPENTSISFTLNNCHTITSLSYKKVENVNDSVPFDIAPL